ncbi:hypothetical protein [uncultured Legionella sp.]|uniref:hypothetical protein n=1 Tax=uncultured Legionella sp. TaxID=210934 RepID=UPI00260E948C|nr:hypothetical protein [uncultured Legionella sp.]
MANNLANPIYLMCGLFLIALIVYSIKKRRKQTRIEQWKKSLNLTSHIQVFQHLYNGVDGFAVSRVARQKKDAIELTYGEIEFIPFIALLSLVNPDKDTVFYDLGCGTGKAVLACSMVYPIQKSIGIELLPELYSIAQQQTEKLATYQDYILQAKKIVILLDDILEADLNEATLIFVNSTTFLGEIWQKLYVRLKTLPKLKTVITTSKALPDEDFTVINSTKLQMSWGVVPAFIHSRKTNCH